LREDIVSESEVQAADDAELKAGGVDLGGLVDVVVELGGSSGL
jgi:hypothetical protein